MRKVVAFHLIPKSHVGGETTGTNFTVATGSSVIIFVCLQSIRPRKE